MNLARRLVIIATVLISLTTASAQAAPVCADLFRTKTPVSRAASEAASLVRRLRAPRFDIQKFDEALATYRENGPDHLLKPKSREARVAFLHYVTSTTGNNPYDLERWAREGTPKERRELAKLIGRFNSDKGFSPAKIDAIYWKLYSYAASNPNTVRNIRRLGLQQMDRVALEQWTTKELASHNAIEAFERLGLLREPGVRGRMMDWMRDHPHVITNLTIGAMMVFEKSLLGIPVTLPMYSRMRVTKLDPELRKIVEENGFDAAYPFLKQRYGSSVRFDRSFYFARRVMTAGLLGYMLVHLVPNLVKDELPPNLVTSDMNAVQITEAAVKYYGDLLIAMADDKVNGTDEREIKVRVGEQQQAPHPKLAAPGTVRVLPQVRTDIVSANRVNVTFNSQIQDDAPKRKKAKATPTTDLGNDDQSKKALDDNLDYLNSLDFRDPTNR